MKFINQQTSLGGTTLWAMDSKASQVFSALNSTIFLALVKSRTRKSWGSHNSNNYAIWYANNELVNGVYKSTYNWGAHILGFMVDLKIVNGDLLKQPTSLGEIVFMGIFLEQPTWVTCN